MFTFSSFTQKWGMKGQMLFVAGILSIFGYLLIYFLPANENDAYYIALLPIFIVGCWFSLFEAAYWSSISIMCLPENLHKGQARKKLEIQNMNSNKDNSSNPKEVEKKLLQDQRDQNQQERMPDISGVAYGIVNTSNNIGLCLFPL